MSIACHKFHDGIQLAEAALCIHTEKTYDETYVVIAVSHHVIFQMRNPFTATSPSHLLVQGLMRSALVWMVQ